MRSETTTDATTQEALQDAVLDSADVEEFLDQLCRHAAESLEDGSEVLSGITLLRHKKAATVASSSEHARAMDEIQYDYDEGPCLTAARDQHIVHVTDLDQEQRWPAYTAAITGHGLHSLVALPFDLAGDAKAALNLYSPTPGHFTAETTARAVDYAAEASRSLRLAVQITQHRETASDLKAAMESRTVIDIATGIIMCQSQCSQEQAIDFLKKASSHRNIKVRELARQIVTGPGTASEPKTHFDN